MNESLDTETDNLRKSWQRLEQKFLRDYLIQGVQDPRINLQSIMSRHFLVDKLFPGEFSSLMEHEIRFSLVANWLIRQWQGGLKQYEQPGILFALLENKRQAFGIEIPKYISDTFGSHRQTSFGLKMALFASGRRQTKAALALAKADLSSLTETKNSHFQQQSRLADDF